MTIHLSQSNTFFSKKVPRRVKINLRFMLRLVKVEYSKTKYPTSCLEETVGSKQIIAKRLQGASFKVLIALTASLAELKERCCPLAYIPRLPKG